MPYTQKWGISRNAFQSPLNHVNTAGSSDHTHNGKPHPDIIEQNNEEANIQDATLINNYKPGPTLIGGGAMNLLGGATKSFLKAGAWLLNKRENWFDTEKYVYKESGKDVEVSNTEKISKFFSK